MQQTKSDHYVIMIHGREYKSWNFLTADKYIPIELDASICCCPAKHKLFSRDVISWNRGQDNEPQIEYSPTRNQLISAVLELDNNRTYGKCKSGKKLLYKCVPNDRYLPAFLVPYSPKNEFNKKMENKYVLLKFDEWLTGQQHPLAKLDQVIGDTSNLTAFYDYQLYSRSLHMKDGFSEFKTVASKNINVYSEKQDIIQTPEYNIRDCTVSDDRIFTIDPKGSTDYDDAFRVTRDTANPNIITISIYISSVYVWLNQLNLWPAFSCRVSTIYLPDYRRPMIPTNLSEHLCSLIADGTTKYAIKWEIQVDLENKRIIDTSQFSHVAVKISKNYNYDSPALDDDVGFALLREATAALDRRHSLDSHDVVAFWMIQMNSESGARLALNHKTGIFRRAGPKDATKWTNSMNDIPIEICGEARRVVCGWKNSTGVYCLLPGSDSGSGEDTLIDMKHDFLDAEYYTHITSPIRRIVDLLNQIMFLNRELGVKLSDQVLQFLEHWTNPKMVEYINATMRSIRKVQMDCDTVAKCYAHPEWMQHHHQGIVFDRIQKTDATFSYMVFLPETKILTRANSIHKVDNYSSHDFALTISPIDHIIRVGFYSSSP